MKTIFVLYIALLALPAFGQQMITNDDLEKKYGTADSSADTDKDAQSDEIKKRREENSKALDSLNCQQLRSAGKMNTAQYRNQCFTAEEKAAWNERVRKNQAAEERRFRKVQQSTRELQQDLKQQERDRKLDDIHRKMTGF